MSAARPLPSSNGPTNSSHLPAANGTGERIFAHIDDLKAEALTDLRPQQSIVQLLERAEKSLAQAKAHVDFRRPDIAFVEYLRACEIAIEILPRHKDMIHFIHDQHGEHKLLVLQRGLRSMDEQFDNIKRIIINNNSRSGVLPKARGQPGVADQVRVQAGSNGTALSPHKSKPAISAKPDNLHARTVSHASASTNGHPTSPSGEALADRFTRLRGIRQGENGTRTNPQSLTSSSQGQQLAMPAASNFASISAPSSQPSFSSSRPQGPRGMPENSNGLHQPPRLPLNTEIVAAMPKAPSPTYSPARNMQTTSNIALPRYTPRSLASSNSRKSSLVLTPTNTSAPNGSVDYFPPSTGNNVPPGPLPRRKSVHVPKETQISAQRLYDYLDRFNILLIDCRTREEFDEGHVFTRNIICVDPIIVRQGMSAAELADKMVLSPEEEVDMFSQRDKFDLVVYYDSSTKSEAYLNSPRTQAETQLRYLHEALYEFNPDKPLQRPPILLVGGISAWIDLIGNQALKVTNTQARLKHGRSDQPQRPAGGAPLRVPKRRLREYNPLDAEEEQSWRARAMSESVPETSAFVRTSEEGSETDRGEEDDESTINDFNTRFPDAHTLGVSSIATGPLRHGPQPPPKVPQYPQAPSPSVYPAVPARPPPAAPRMSYTGVSDRAVSQNTPTPRTTSQLVPYISPKYLSSNLRIPRTGLANFGSTCYMNATLQALSATTPLSIMFLDDQFKQFVQKDNWKGSRGLLPDIYANTIRSLWKGDVNYIKPTTFFNFVGRLNSMFRDPGQQQDAQEFFSMIVDVLHEDLNAQWGRSPLRALTEQEEKTRERMPKLVVAKTEWGKYTHRDNSFLTSLFYQQQSSRLQCPKCGLTSTQYDALALLQVEIPDGKEARLQDCLRSHFKDEMLDEDNQWTCPNCKAPRRAWKKLTMTRAPPFLVVSLKRFKTNAKTGDQRKIHTAVRFPLTGLDMEEFVLPHPPPEEAQKITAQYGTDSLKTDISLTPPYIYDAYAIVRHMGESTRSGHYTAAVKDKARGCWRYFNDSTATDFEPEKLNPAKALDNDQAYLLFYQRRSPNEANKF